MMLLRRLQLHRPLTSILIIIVIVLSRLHLIISAPTSAVRATADDVTDHVTPSSQQGSNVTERERSVVSNGETSQSVRSNAADSATKNRPRRQLQASQGCGPVCNRCRQVYSSEHRKWQIQLSKINNNNKVQMS